MKAGILPLSSYWRKGFKVTDEVIGGDMKYLGFTLALVFFAGMAAEGQILERLGKRVKRKVEERIERKTDEAVDKGLDKVEDATEGKDGENDGSGASGDGKSGKDGKDAGLETIETTEAAGNIAGAADLNVYSKFDFVPGNRIIFYDDFAIDHTGDFPSKWNTNASGEVVELGESREKYFQLSGGALYLPILENPLPEEYTIEFDLKTTGLDKEISSTTFFDIILDESATLQKGNRRAAASLSFCQFISNGLDLVSYGGSMGTIKNTIEEDYRKAMAGGPHISIAVNKKRFRLWINERKMVDVPTFMPPGASHLKLSLRGFDTDYKQMKVYIGNFKIAAGGVDLRSELISKGRWTTTGILFDVNSARVRPESYGVLKEIAGVLQQNPDVKVQIIGHTDADGSEELNLKLSQERAASVKTALTNEFGIAADRMETGGKGESVPVDGNDTPEGKAKNRRVEFIKR